MKTILFTRRSGTRNPLAAPGLDVDQASRTHAPQWGGLPLPTRAIATLSDAEGGACPPGFGRFKNYWNRIAIDE
jgi:hypothetical protein